MVGVDLSVVMIKWARQRAHRAGVEDLVDLVTANVLALPFADDSFDAVTCESVLTFVADKAAAIAECVRVTRPGGFVGLNEGLWLTEPPPELAERVRAALGPSILTEQGWCALWADSSLQDREVRIRHVDARAEVRSRVRWIGWPWLLRAWGRGLRLYLRDSKLRRSIRDQLDVPQDVFNFVGYGLLVGRGRASSPTPDARSAAIGASRDRQEAPTPPTTHSSAAEGAGTSVLPRP